MSNVKNGIRDLLAATNEAKRQATQSTDALRTKLANCGKMIQGVECSFLTDGSSIDVRLRRGDGSFTTSVEEFWSICGWFSKHYNGKDDAPENGAAAE